MNEEVGELEPTRTLLHLSIRLHSLMASKSICLALKPLVIHPLCETQGLLICVCGASWMFIPKTV